MRTIRLRSGEQISAIGQGTWYMGDRKSEAAREVTALQLGIDLGMTLIDTAEMYADGGAERIVAQALDGTRKILMCAAPATLIVGVQPAAVVHDEPKSRSVEFAQICDDQCKYAFHAFIVQSPRKMMVIDEIVTSLGT